MRPQLVIFYLLLPVICLGDYPADTPTFHVIKRVWDGRVFYPADATYAGYSGVIDCSTYVDYCYYSFTSQSYYRETYNLAFRFPCHPNPSLRTTWFGIYANPSGELVGDHMFNNFYVNTPSGRAYLWALDMPSENIRWGLGDGTLLDFMDCCEDIEWGFFPTWNPSDFRYIFDSSAFFRLEVWTVGYNPEPIYPQHMWELGSIYASMDVSVDVRHEAPPVPFDVPMFTFHTSKFWSGAQCLPDQYYVKWYVTGFFGEGNDFIEDFCFHEYFTDQTKPDGYIYWSVFRPVFLPPDSPPTIDPPTNFPDTDLDDLTNSIPPYDPPDSGIDTNLPDLSPEFNPDLDQYIPGTNVPETAEDWFDIIVKSLQYAGNEYIPNTNDWEIGIDTGAVDSIHSDIDLSISGLQSEVDEYLVARTNVLGLGFGVLKDYSSPFPLEIAKRSSISISLPTFRVGNKNVSLGTLDFRVSDWPVVGTFREILAFVLRLYTSIMCFRVVSSAFGRNG